MHRVLTVVEGFTERAVLEQTLAPYLGSHQLSLHAKVVGKPGHKGGVRSFAAVGREIMALLKQERASHVSTFFDYYGLPMDWPGLLESKGKDAKQAASIVEESMRVELDEIMGSSESSDRFIPYVQMHELEALLFADVKVMAGVFERPDLESQFAQILTECGECEEINDDEATAPSKRIEKLVPTYRKGAGIRAHAPRIVKHIGVDKLRKACPHFDGWLTTLEKLAGNS